MDVMILNHLVVELILIGLLIYREMVHTKDKSALLDRLMAKNWSDYVYANIAKDNAKADAKKAPDKKPNEYIAI